MKNYQVFYWIKKNKKEYLEHIFVTANNAKEACTECRKIVYEKTGRNAFRPTTKAPTEQEMEMYRKSKGLIVD